MEKVKVGIIGTGNIFGAYVKGCRTFEILDLAACADLDPAAAETKGAEFEVPVRTVSDLLADPEIRIVINLTVPAAHAAVSLQIIRAGKNVHSEKPLAVTRAEGQEVLAAAREAGLLVGCAPDTFLGGGQQTCRKLIDDGWIGEPVAASAFFLAHGPEGWHPNPGFFYLRGGGPLFDMGPYYLTSLINLLGPVARVSGSARISFRERVSPGPKRPGERFPVEVPTHVTGVLDFASGPVATLITSFDAWSNNLPRIEIYGSQGSLSVPDPNIFRGPVLVRRAGAESWSEVPLTHSGEVGRGIGVADMAYALECGRPHRTSGALAYHVLDVMHSILDASQAGKHMQVQSHVERPAALPLGLRLGQLDE